MSAHRKHHRISGRHHVVHALWLGVSLLYAQPARAEPLDLNSCLSLWQKSLTADRNGTKALLAGGPEGAQDRLSKTQLGQVKAYIKLIEQLKFRCPRFVPPPPGAQSF